MSPDDPSIIIALHRHDGTARAYHERGTIAHIHADVLDYNCWRCQSEADSILYVDQCHPTDNAPLLARKIRHASIVFTNPPHEDIRALAELPRLDRRDRDGGARRVVRARRNLTTRRKS